MKKRYRVYIRRVELACLDVFAEDEDAAEQIAESSEPSSFMVVQKFEEIHAVDEVKNPHVYILDAT